MFFWSKSRNYAELRELHSRNFDKLRELRYNLDMIKRHYDDLKKFIKQDKINIIYGPRQVGKTTLLKNYLNSLTNKRYLYKTGEELDIVEIFEKPSIDGFKNLTSNLDLLVIDEAQMLPNVGAALKIIKDHIPELQVIVTGSASLDLVNKVGEPLTGRNYTIQLYPIAQMELALEMSHFELKNKLDSFLIYGSYPEVFHYKNNLEKEEYLISLVNSYLLKDVLALEKVKGSKVILDLLRLLAYQIGSEVSTTELGSQLNLDNKTVVRYLDLLEKAFVLINVRGFSRNLRKEISKSSRYYFYDNGIRNALIKNFNQLNLRNDLGMLWENFLVSERIKKQHYAREQANNYFWRTYDQKEIDWLEERAGVLSGFEFKWGDKTPLAPKDFTDNYESTEFKVINRDNYFEFVK